MRNLQIFILSVFSFQFLFLNDLHAERLKLATSGPFYELSVSLFGRNYEDKPIKDLNLQNIKWDVNSCKTELTDALKYDFGIGAGVTLESILKLKFKVLGTSRTFLTSSVLTRSSEVSNGRDLSNSEDIALLRKVAGPNSPLNVEFDRLEKAVTELKKVAKSCKADDIKDTPICLDQIKVIYEVFKKMEDSVKDSNNIGTGKEVVKDMLFKLHIPNSIVEDYLSTASESPGEICRKAFYGDSSKVLNPRILAQIQLVYAAKTKLGSPPKPAQPATDIVPLPAGVKARS